MTTTTTLKSDTLRPGLLVSFKSSISGGINYIKETIESEHMVEGVGEKARWETTRTIADPAEYARAQKTREKASSLVRSACAKSAFGLLCPEADADKLATAIREANRLATEFNATAQLSRLSVFVITGRIAPDDVEAVRAINSEIKDLMTLMAEGIDKLDVKKVREAASKSKQIATMLPADMQARVQLAVETARDAARKIVKAGEDAAVEIDQSAIRKIREQRVAFLDLTDTGDVAMPAQQGRAVDLAPVAEVKAPKKRQRTTIEVD